MFKKLAFLIFVGIVSCAPQGYNYHHNQNNGLQTSSLGTNQFTSQSVGHNQPSHAFLQEALSQAGNLQSFTVQPQQNFVSHIVPQQSFGNNVAPVHHQQSFVNHHAPAPVVTKDIYVHAAPEEPEEQFSQPQLPSLPPRKHYRIVFIKAPTQNIKQQSIRLSQAPTEEKTIIYVLSKKDEPIDIQAALQDIQPTQPSKPEVYFIKYKTQEEAAHAQRQIQAQYDSLGGSTQISDEGIAPISSVIGSLGHQQGNTNVQSSYLPPSLKK